MIRPEKDNGFFYQPVFIQLLQQDSDQTIHIGNVAIETGHIVPDSPGIRVIWRNFYFRWIDMQWMILPFPYLGFMGNCIIHYRKKWLAGFAVSPAGFGTVFIPYSGRSLKLI